MKQGRATHSGSGSTKVEPHSRAVSPSHVSEMGSMQGNHTMEEGTIRVRSAPMYEGRGLEAPMAGTTIHKSGSQGKR